MVSLRTLWCPYTVYYSYWFILFKQLCECAFFALTGLHTLDYALWDWRSALAPRGSSTTNAQLQRRRPTTSDPTKWKEKPWNVSQATHTRHNYQPYHHCHRHAKCRDPGIQDPFWFFFLFGGITGCGSASLKLWICSAASPWSQGTSPDETASGTARSKTENGLYSWSAPHCRMGQDCLWDSEEQNLFVAPHCPRGSFVPY